MQRCSKPSYSKFAAVWIVLCGLLLPGSQACGPFFPFAFLEKGDEALLHAPRTVFHEELLRLNAVPTYPHLPAPRGFAQQTIESDVAELAEALRAAQVPASKVEEACSAQKVIRANIQNFIQAHENWVNRRENARHLSTPFTNPEPTLVSQAISTSVPAEFSDYLQGALAYHQGQTRTAAAAWERLMNRPANERRYRSTWAAFMLGRLYWEDKPHTALDYFRACRQFANERFPDSLGLAVTSLGWEARIRLRQGDHLPAIHLYLEQFAAGVESAEASLRVAILDAFEAGSGALRTLASDDRTRRVVTAYLLSGNSPGLIDVDATVKHVVMDFLSRSSRLAPRVMNWHRMNPTCTLWLEALEKAAVEDLAPAEELALAAYQAGQWSMTQRWINRAPHGPVCQWLQAKLYLREGDFDKAAAALAAIVSHFPVEPAFQSRQTSLGPRTVVLDEFSGASFLMGEYGVVQLARRQFTEALDALMRGGFWTDAAYVAERVLTLDELKEYVDQHASASGLNARAEQNHTALRYLLGRRLARTGRYVPEYFPDEYCSMVVALDRELAQGNSSVTPKLERAVHLFNAATLLRTNGLELIGTELAPDWAIHQGQFDYGGATVETRSPLVPPQLSGPSAEELQRAQTNRPATDQRFHYRYLAADLAWQAAQLSPDNDERTAAMLATAGNWLKQKDPKAADRFYKALVRRCRQTPLGAQADHQRWFP